jgi:CRP/FNR family transcriptional regulator, cyclic AMP receptor protein
MTTDTMAALRQCAFFDEFQPKHMEKLMRLGTEHRYQKGEVIFREGEDSHLFFVLLSGRVALEANVGGKQVLIQTLFPSDELGWSAILGQKRQFQARALEQVEVMAFEVPLLRDSCKGNPYFGYAFMGRLFQVVAERLEGTRQQLVAALAELHKTSE